MPDDTTNLPAPADESRHGTSLAALAASPALAIWFDDRLFERAKLMATYLSKADGVVPRHLIGKPEACFAVVNRALTWRLDPYAVAQSTYQTPGGSIGYEGKLCQAILENSGRLVGGVKFELYGDWAKVKGKFEIKTGNSGKPYPAPTWTRKDAAGLGVTVRAQVKGELEPREIQFDLDTAFPLNSTLWATRPDQQIKYTAVRAFANTAMPGIFLGVPFDGDELPAIGPDRAVDVTPARPQRNDFITPLPEAFEITTPEGEVRTFDNPNDAAAAFATLIAEASTAGVDAVDGLWESNNLSGQLRDRGFTELADGVQRVYVEAVAELNKQRAAARDQAQALQGAPMPAPPKFDKKAGYTVWKDATIAWISATHGAGWDAYAKAESDLLAWVAENRRPDWEAIQQALDDARG